MKDVAVYTAIFGNYDELKEPPFPELLDKAAFYCITDNAKLQSNFFTVIYEKPKQKDSVRDARYYKIMGHPILDEYAYSIWIDGAFEIKNSSLTDVVSYLKETDIALFKHGERNCVYDEAAACIRFKKEKMYVVFRQIMGYFFKGMPSNLGLNETSLLVRRAGFSSSKIFEDWWLEVRDKSKRDQLSFNYTLYSNRKKCDIIPGYNKSNTYFKRKKHNLALSSGEMKLTALELLFIKFIRIVKLIAPANKHREIT